MHKAYLYIYLAAVVAGQDWQTGWLDWLWFDFDWTFFNLINLLSFTLHFPTKYKSPAMPTFAITQTKFNTNYNGSHTATATATAAAATATVIPCKWYPYGHRLVNGINCDLLPFLRKHFANETDTSSVSARLESARNAAPGSRQPTGKLALPVAHIYHILRRLMVVIKMLSAQHLPHWHLLANQKWSTHVAICPRSTPRDVQRNWMPAINT